MAEPADAGNRLRSPAGILVAVGFAVFVAADDLTVVTTMLRPIINDLGLALPDGLDDAAWIVNVYLIAFVAVMPLAGRLSDVIGRRRLLLGAFVVFLIGTTAIPLTSSVGPFLVGRVLTAIGGGAMLPVALAVVGDVFDEQRRARALGTLGAIETLGWVWGPLYGALLVRFLDWRWQFWLNIPLGLLGMYLIWAAVPDHTERRSVRSVDWTGAALLAATLVALDLALLGNAEIQSVSGLDELQGGDGFNFALLFPVAAALGIALVLHQRRTADPLVDPGFFRGRVLQVALFVNLLVGGALVIAMVDVPIFVNAVELDLERSAVVSGWLLAALTAAMSVASWVGGRAAERFGARWPTVAGLAAAAAALLAMGLTWEPDIAHVSAALQLAVLGAGLGLVFAPTTAAVIEASAPEQRGAAASIVMVVRLVGLSVGLAALTAWGLARFNELRGQLELPGITDPGFEQALTAASAQLTADSIADTFLAAAAVTGLGLLVGFAMRDRPSSTQPRTTKDTTMDSFLSGRLSLLIGVLTAIVAVLTLLVGWMYFELGDTQDELSQTRADLQRVEEGAAGSAIVATQVLALTQQLAELSPQVDEGLDQAITELEAFGTSELEFEVAIDEVIDFQTDITIDRDFSFPIDESIAIEESIDTTIRIDTPLGFDVPVDVNVPVDVDVPIQLDVEVPINETVPIDARVPVMLDVPIRVDLADTELSRLAEQLATALRQVKEVLADLTG